MTQLNGANGSPRRMSERQPGTMSTGNGASLVTAARCSQYREVSSRRNQLTRSLPAWISSRFSIMRKARRIDPCTKARQKAFLFRLWW